MVNPSAINVLVNEAESTAKAALAELAFLGVETGEKGVAAVTSWRNRMVDLLRSWKAGMAQRDYLRAVQSENEALSLNLAAIANEQARAAVQGILGASLDFLGKILSVGLRSIGA